MLRVVAIADDYVRLVDEATGQLHRLSIAGDVAIDDVLDVKIICQRPKPN